MKPTIKNGLIKYYLISGKDHVHGEMSEDSYRGIAGLHEQENSSDTAYPIQHGRYCFKGVAQKAETTKKGEKAKKKGD